MASSTSAPTTNFSFETLHGLAFEQQKDYLKQYFVPLETGDHVILKVNKEGKTYIKILETKVLKEVYFNRIQHINANLHSWYFKEYLKLRELICEIGKPMLFENYLNQSAPFKHKVSDYESFDQAVKDRVQLFLSYIKEVLCNHNEEAFQYVLKWLSVVVKGGKNESCLYLRTKTQGSGKSTLFDFMRHHVIGDGLFLETGSEPIKSKFNSILAGKLIVFFEELETTSISEWCSVSSRLKRYITSTTMTIEPKGLDSYNVKNYNNYVIASNNDAIKDDDGRRYFIADVSTHRIGDKAYWKNLRQSCFNDEVGHAFFCYLSEIDTSEFNSQHDMPLTQRKKDSYAKRLDSVELFLKSYVLENRAIHSTVDEFHKEYCEVSSKHLGKLDFNSRMTELGIQYKPQNRKNETTGKMTKVNEYRVSAETLREIAEKGHWIHELDNFEPSEISTEPEIDTEKEQLKTENDKLKQQLKELQEQMEALKKLIPLQRTPPEVADATPQEKPAEQKPKRTKKAVVKKEVIEIDEQTDDDDDDVFNHVVKSTKKIKSKEADTLKKMLKTAE